MTANDDYRKGRSASELEDVLRNADLKFVREIGRVRPRRDDADLGRHLHKLPGRSPDDPSFPRPRFPR